MLEIYLEELEKSLAQHNISSEQILNEIKEQIKLYEEAGLTEEEIIKRLPSIEELIYQNMQVTADKKQLIELQLDLKSCSDLLIKSSPNPGISYQIDDEDLLPYFEIENIHQKLSIKETGKLLSSKISSYDLTILYGPDISFSDININAISTDISLNFLTINKLKINVVSGDISLKDLIIGNASVSSVSGDLSFVNGTINEDCKLSTVSGDIEMLNTSLNGKTNIKTVSGDAILKGNNFDQNKIAMSTISGELQINKQVVASLSSKLQDMFKNMF